MNGSHIKTAFIPGAGFGTRLHPLTNACPKPLLPVGGRPIITYVMDHLITAGIERFIINTHHCAEIYHQAFPDNQWRGNPIIFRHEPVLLDTAGGLKNIEDLLDTDDAVMVYNGDIIADMPLMPLIETHVARKKEVTLALRSGGSPLNVNINDGGDVCDLRHTLGEPGVRSCLFTGIYIVEKPFLRRLKAHYIESVIPVFIEMIRENIGSVAGVLIDEGRWQDIGSLKEYEKMYRAFSQTGVPEGLRNEKLTSRGFWTHTMKTLDKEMREFAEQALIIEGSGPVHMTPLAGGGSNRSFHRIHYGDKSTAVFMHYDVSREENNCYGAIAGFLEKIGVAVPRIMAHDATRGFIVMEDMGNMDLWSLRHQPWRVKQGHYRKVLNVIYRLHAFPLRNFPADQIPLMKGFGPDIYRWEHEYFLGNFVRAFCGIKMSGPESEALWEELGDLTKRLEHTVLCLVHRDFQSRNIMIRDGEPVLIDFQGMRSGNLLYDLGSLLYDPYVFFTEDERMDLLMHYFQRQNILPSSWSAFKEMFYDAASQRLMQALGAYGFLGITRGLKDFLTHIPNGLTNLIDASARTKHMPCLSALARKCNDRCDPCLSVDTTTA